MKLKDADALLELYDGCEGLHVPVEVVIQNIKDMPTIEAVPVNHGHWIKDIEEDAIGCSKCHNWLMCDNVIENCDPIRDLDMHYCPYCGAKMDDDISKTGKLGCETCKWFDRDDGNECKGQDEPCHEYIKQKGAER